MRSNHREFLPAVLEIQETPPSCTGRCIMWITIIMLIFFICWAAIGEIDVVAQARGKLVVPRLSRPVHSAVTAEIAAVLVHEGQKVNKGAPLILLNSQTLQAQRDENLLRQRINSLNIYRLERLLQYYDGNQEKMIAHSPPAGPLLAPTLMRLQSEIQAYSREVQQLMLSQKVLAAQIDSYLTQQAAAEKRLPLYQKQLRAMETLFKQGHTSEDSLLELRKNVLEANLTLTSAQKKMTEGLTNLEQAKSEFASWKAAKTEKSLQEKSEIVIENAILATQLKQLDAQLKQYRLVAPVSGVVESLTFFDAGSAVEAAGELLKIVPDKEKLSAEVWIRNQDIGFLQRAQPVTIKIDTFDFTRYGWIKGTLTQISADATEHKELGLVYKATISLEEESLMVDGKLRLLEPGMSVSAEIKTSKRTLLSFLLSPMLEALDSVGRQR